MLFTVFPALLMAAYFLILFAGVAFIQDMLVLLSTITAVYPAYKFVQELAQYARIRKEYGI